MRQSFILLAIFTIQAATAQPGVSPYYKAPDPYAGKILVIPAGTTFEGRIGSTIGSTISKQGERFTVSISSPLLANGSDVLIPAGAEVLGEVVQAIPANQVPHQKKEKPIGKLRVQITSLRMPDGMTFPMVGSIVGEEAVSGTYGGYGMNQHDPLRGSGIGYVGTPAGFHSVAPGQSTRGYRGNNASQVVTKEELLNDPILGREQDMDRGNKAAIRSLVKKNRNLYIYSGSPLTIRLEAPFKMGMSASDGEASALGVKPLGSEENSIPVQAPPPFRKNPPSKTAPPSQPGSYQGNPGKSAPQDSNF